MLACVHMHAAWEARAHAQAQSRSRMLDIEVKLGPSLSGSRQATPRHLKATDQRDRDDSKLCVKARLDARTSTNAHTEKDGERHNLCVSLLPLQLLSSPLLPLVESFDIVSKPGFL